MISRTGGIGLTLTREQKTLLESIFWLALGYGLGCQDKQWGLRVNNSVRKTSESRP
jgi:hypothetical protein